MVRRKVMPTVFGLGMLLWLAGAGNRALFEGANGLGRLCQSDGATELEPLQSRTVTFSSQRLCFPTGIRLKADEPYTIAVSLPPTGWQDKTVPVSSTRGFSSWDSGLSRVQRGVFTVSVPFRRVWRDNWFVPIARVGEGGFEQYSLKTGRLTFIPRTSNELFLFVNDAVGPLGWGRFYGNNEGAAAVTVTRERPCPRCEVAAD